jgi:hypothetical protein
VRDRLAGVLTSFGPFREQLHRRMAMLTVDYRGSPVVGEERAWPFPSANLGDAVSDLRRWHDFGSGPRPGDHAPDARLSDGCSLHEEALRGHAGHTLLLFAGGAPDEEEETPRRLSDVASTAEARYGHAVKSWLVVHGDDAPAAGGGAAEVLLDPEGAPRRRYGARADCL